MSGEDLGLVLAAQIAGEITCISTRTTTTPCTCELF